MNRHDSHGHGAHDLPNRTPAPLRPCDLFSEEIHLLVDRELGEAEREIVESHLAECPRCLGLATHLERMSSVLKAWDARENEVPAPDMRLQHAVLSRVADSGARRRRDDRFVRVLHMATAAVVVLGIGLAVVFGLADTRAPVQAPTFEVSDAPWPLDNRERPQTDLPTTPFEDRLTGADLLAGVAPTEFVELQGDPQLVTDEHMRLFRSGDDTSLAALDRRAKRLELFEQRLGEPAMFWNGPNVASIEPRLVPQSTYRYLQQSDILERWRTNSTPRSPSVAPSDEARPSQTPTPAVAGTGVLPKAMLGAMPGITHPLRLGKQRSLITFPGMHPFQHARTKSGKPKSTKGLPALLELRALGQGSSGVAGLLKSGPLAGGARPFLDPIVAAANGQLRFAESHDQAGRIVAFVQNTGVPIFIPAGQFITDGHGDRVVRHPIWLPPSKSTTPHLIECFVVQGMPNVDAKGDPRLSPLVAGPTIRALLASGAGQADVKAAAAAICKAHRELYGALFRDWKWSLRETYAAMSNQGAGANGTDVYARIRWQGAQGFLATDGRGRMLGFELLRAEGPAADALLGRLARGYAAEAIWRIQSEDLRKAFAAPSDDASRVLRLLAEHPADFRIPDGVTEAPGARTSTLELEASGLHLHALEVGQAPLFVSALAAP